MTTTGCQVNEREPAFSRTLEVENWSFSEGHKEENTLSTFLETYQMPRSERTAGC